MPYVRGELLTKVYGSELMVDAPAMCQELDERELVALLYHFVLSACVSLIGGYSAAAVKMRMQPVKLELIQKVNGTK